MVNLRPVPKPEPLKIPHLYVDLIPESMGLSLSPFIGSSSLRTSKDTPSPLRRLSFRVYMAINRDLYWLFEPRGMQREFYAHTFIVYIFVDLIVFVALS